MAMTVIEIEAIPDEALPLDQLAAQMRLADGAIDNSDQAVRLRLRLRAAIDDVERRLGRILIERLVTVSGSTEGGRRIGLPAAPVVEISAVFVSRGGADVPFGRATVEPGPYRADAVLASPIREGEIVRLILRAGFGRWADIPDGIRQAVLLMAEALDVGEGPVLAPMAEALLAPYRTIRIGRAG